ncbi:hypothetical protein EDD18DRAFT_430164 [Armillaria luteobubalina]|uniref:Uncharacterized protein n=1 Tax=Armillaria luteobubalina TaxID=153913 RepID=A0AA39PZL2_9AGAR|nr:hypothetical protein EDD18DRAFT_430164 [Armillaria luteobubalina]
MCVASNQSQIDYFSCIFVRSILSSISDGQEITKYLVYGIYIIEFAQTMIFTYDAFATFGYGFGDMEALTGMYFNWFTVPIMSALLVSDRSSMRTESSYYLSHLLVPIFVHLCVLDKSCGRYNHRCLVFPSGQRH